MKEEINQDRELWKKDLIVDNCCQNPILYKRMIQEDYYEKREKLKGKIRSLEADIEDKEDELKKLNEELEKINIMIKNM